MRVCAYVFVCVYIYVKYIDTHVLRSVSICLYTATYWFENLKAPMSEQQHLGFFLRVSVQSCHIFPDLLSNGPR